MMIALITLISHNPPITEEDFDVIFTITTIVGFIIVVSGGCYFFSVPDNGICVSKEGVCGVDSKKKLLLWNELTSINLLGKSLRIDSSDTAPLYLSKEASDFFVCVLLIDSYLNDEKLRSGLKEILAEER